MYKIIFTIFFFATIIMIAQNSKSKMNLMPYPQNVKVSKGSFRLNNKLVLQSTKTGERLKKTSNRFLKRLAERTGLFFEYPLMNPTENNVKPTMIIEVSSVGEVKLNVDESYKIKITESKILLTAKTDVGAMRGVETILQLLSIDNNGYYFPTVEINDSPRFPWRGLLIDVCRHFMPIEVIKRNLDGMAAVKMNVFHWHLSEDQGFRVESKIYPKLTELGSDGLFYTQEQVKEIIRYATNRGIRVIPEFDVPGHATAILTAYPELASASGPYNVERDWGIFDPTLNPIIDETYEFLDNLFGEMSQLFTDEYFHIGGDENNGKQWDANKEIQKFMKENNLKDNHALQGYFNKRVLKILTKYNKKMIGWDEIFHPSMPNNIVIQSWRGKESLVDAAKKGYQVILSNGYYIDLMQPTDFHYLNDPLPKDIKLTDKEKQFILGGEATMWAEMISHETIDSRIWPRTAVIAERLWSPQNVKDIKGMYERLERISYLLEEHGLTHIKNIDMMLRRLTNNKDIEPLRKLISVLEPVKIYKRNGLRKQTQQTPLTRVVDVASADAKVAREFRNLVNSFLDDPNFNDEKYKKMVSQLMDWKNNHQLLLPIIESSPILREIKPMSKIFSDLSALALEILEVKKSTGYINENIFNKATPLIEKAKVPIAQTEIMILPAIVELFGSILDIK